MYGVAFSQKEEKKLYDKNIIVYRIELMETENKKKRKRKEKTRGNQLSFQGHSLSVAN